MSRLPRPGRAAPLVALVVLAGLTQTSRGQSYRIERIASDLDQPTYVTQAPGDPANILYYTERTTNPAGGFGVTNDMGRVWRYDVQTRTKTLVLDLSNRNVVNDTGLQTIAFSPEFNTPGSPGHRKFYASLAQAGGTARNRVEEYVVGEDGAAQFSRLILQYDNNTQNNHTVNWIGFDPTASGGGQNDLYISTGDGSFGNSYDGGSSPFGRPSQNPSDLRGKILRVDVSGGDDYPSDDLKNFAIPASNPIPAYNAAHPDAPIMGVQRIGQNIVPAPALGEVWATGVRNGYRASFDRGTGDLYYGDVGENNWEEVNFLKAGANEGGPPVDFGWPQLEATHDGVSSAPHTSLNPFTGVESLNPIREYAHPAGFAAIGGYVYRGPVEELHGRYFFADFVRNGQVWMVDFDRDTDPGAFDGDNGVIIDMTDLWQSLVIDLTDPAYLPDSGAASPAGLDHIVSFGEDNAGNLYLVDFGNGSGFQGQYPPAGRGEIFRVTPLVPEPPATALAWLAAAAIAVLRIRAFRPRDWTTGHVCVHTCRGRRPQ